MILGHKAGKVETELQSYDLKANFFVNLIGKNVSYELQPVEICLDTVPQSF